MLRHACFGALILGSTVHVLLFSRNEWDLHSLWIFLSFCMVTVCTCASLVLASEQSLCKAILETNILSSCFLAGLFSSMMAYRLIYHPLRSFPGPFCARITAFWLTKESIPDLKFYKKLCGLHDRYGDFVRIRKATSCLSPETPAYEMMQDPASSR
jgi:hypothetical protein